MNRKVTSTLRAGAAFAAFGLASPALAAPAADGMPRDLVAEGQNARNQAYVRPVAEDGETKAREEREGYLERTRRKLDETGEEIANSEIGEGVEDAWNEVQVQWDRLIEATAETWDDARASFEDSWEEFEAEWNEATGEDS